MSTDAFTTTAEVPVIPPTPPPRDVDDDDDVPRPLGKVNSDDVFAGIGSFISSFALIWLLYFEILPLNGLIGFVVCWWIGFLAMYGGVTALSHPRTVVIDRVMGAVVTGTAVLIGFVLVTVVSYTIWRGHLALDHANFYLQNGSQGSLTGPLNKGGIKNDIVGSVIQVGIAVVISLPLGIGTAVFMTEVGGWFARAVRTVVEAMTAVPDLLAGLFIYTVLIIELHGRRNGLAVALALSVTGTPIIARSAEIALRVVPGGLREAGLALGSSQWQTVRRIVLPTARPGLATALILAVARMIGESAPLIIVSGFSLFWDSNPVNGNPMNSLPLYIYETIRQGTGHPNELIRGFGAAVVLLVMVFVLFMFTRLVARQRVTR